MAISGTKKWAVKSVLLTAVAQLNCVNAAEPLLLRASLTLESRSTPSPFSLKSRMTEQSLLGKVNLFRGVVVGEGVSRSNPITPAKIEFNSINDKAQSVISAVYGGLQLSLQQNLSLVYTPGSLSSATLNSESQGLYLLSNRGGLANWFLGVESRRVSNTAQFGVIMSLN